MELNLILRSFTIHEWKRSKRLLLFSTTVCPDHHVAVGGQVLHLGGLSPAHSNIRPPACWPSSAGVMFGQVPHEGLPSASNTDHHMSLIQHLWCTEATLSTTIHTPRFNDEWSISIRQMMERLGVWCVKTKNLKNADGRPETLHSLWLHLLSIPPPPQA